MERVARELESENVSGHANVRTFRTCVPVSTLSRHLTTPPTTALLLDAAKQSGSRTLQVLDHAVTRDVPRTRADSIELKCKSTLARADNTIHDC